MHFCIIPTNGLIDLSTTTLHMLFPNSSHCGSMYANNYLPNKVFPNPSNPFNPPPHFYSSRVQITAPHQRITLFLNPIRPSLFVVTLQVYKLPFKRLCLCHHYLRHLFPFPIVWQHCFIFTMRLNKIGCAVEVQSQNLHQHSKYIIHKMLGGGNYVNNPIHYSSPPHNRQKKYFGEPEHKHNL